MMKPTVVDKFMLYNGQMEVNKPQVVRKINISDKTLKLMQNALRLPVIGYGGTAKILKFNDLAVSAKTGTAQNTGFRDHHSWIAGYFPSDNPEIVFVSIVEGGGYGGTASGNMARIFIEKYRELDRAKKNAAAAEAAKKQEQNNQNTLNNQNLQNNQNEQNNITVQNNGRRKKRGRR
jgi:penicillin-binding protein 2